MEKISAVIAPELKRDRDRWEGFIKYVPVGQEIEDVNLFADERPPFLRNEIAHYFHLPGLSEISLSVEPASAGMIKINTITPMQYPWTGTYFQKIPITITAIASPDWEFDHWEGMSEQKAISPTFDPGEKVNAKAIFRKKP